MVDLVLEDMPQDEAQRESTPGRIDLGIQVSLAQPCQAVEDLAMDFAQQCSDGRLAGVVLQGVVRRPTG